MKKARSATAPSKPSMRGAAPAPKYLNSSVRPANTAPNTNCARALLEEVLNKPVTAFPQVTVERRAVEGTPGTLLVAASHTADLLVVGAHRRHGHAGLQLGLVTHTVLHHA
ncbi:universal stress protein [Streptomyces ochraceiscleroticus]